METAHHDAQNEEIAVIIKMIQDKAAEGEGFYQLYLPNQDAAFKQVTGVDIPEDRNRVRAERA